jgi:uncharacterized membrane protein
VLALATLLLGDPNPVAAQAVPDGTVLDIVHRHCTSCHAASPTHPAFSEAPKGVTLEDIRDLRQHADAIMQQAVLGKAMPMGNQTQMTDRERAILRAWIEGQL